MTVTNTPMKICQNANHVITEL